MRVFIFAFFFFFCFSLHSYAQLRLNEFMSLNESAFADNQNNYTDWIELYNTNTDSLLLLDYYLSDDSDNLYKWQLPNQSLQTKEHLIIYASGLDLDLHANFKISSQGESLYLSNKANGIVDSLPAVNLAKNQAFGRFPDGSENLGKLKSSTPNTLNDSIELEFNALRFSHASGFYENPFELSIEPLSYTAQIYYTINGAEPTLTDIKYLSPIEINDLSDKENTISEIPTSDNWKRPKTKVFKGHIIKVAAFKDGQLVSKVYTQSYFVSPKMMQRYTFPIVSLSTAPENLFDDEIGVYVKGHNTNYSERGREWERIAQFEYFDTSGKRLVNQKVGLRTNGNKGRTLAQKSLLIYARSSYGNKRLNYPFYTNKDSDSFKRIIIRSASSNDWKNTMFKNELAQRIVIDMNIEHPASQEVIVFINGEYWGIQHLNERTDEYFIEDYFDEDNIDLLSLNAQDEEGSNIDFLNLKGYIETNDLSQNIHYQYVSEHIDIDNIIDYYCAQLFFSNTDWPHNNVKYWKAQNHGKWRWLFFDCDECMNYEYYDLMSDLVNAQNSNQDFPEWSTFVIRNLLKNKGFKLSFRQRFEELLTTTFNTTNLIQHIQDMENLYAPEINEHCMRWSSPDNINDWHEAVKSLYSFATLRPQIMREQLKGYFGVPFNLFPNPASKLLSIDVLSDENEVESIHILNNLGHSVYKQNGVWNNPLTLPLLQKGFYIVRVRFTDYMYSEQLIVH